MNKISGIYKITNTITNDFYIGSSKNVKSRWAAHQWPSKWNEHPNNPMYQDMQKYGIENFEFEIIEEVEEEQMKEAEQQFIESLNPTYNNYNADGLNVDKRKKSKRKANKKYYKSDKGKESLKKAQNKYQNQLCFYNGETLTLHALYQRFKSQGLSNPTAQAKKYLIEKSI